MVLVVRVELCLAGGLLDGVLALLLVPQIGDGTVIVSVAVDVSLYRLLGSVLHFVVPLVDPGVVQSISVRLEGFVPESREQLCSVFLLREEPLVGIALDCHFEV